MPQRVSVKRSPSTAEIRVASINKNCIKTLVAREIKDQSGEDPTVKEGDSCRVSGI